MRSKSITWDQMGANGHGKRQVRGLVIGWYKKLSNLEEILWWCGAVWFGRELALLPRVMVGWMGISTFRFWRMSFSKLLEHYDLNPPDIIFQQNNDPKHICKKVKGWLKKQDFRTMVWPAVSWPKPYWTFLGMAQEETCKAWKPF